MSNINPRWGSWATPPEPFKPEDFQESLETEVLVVGAGIAGLSCAYSAAECGCKVTVMEKLPTYHGFAHNVGVVNSRFMRSLLAAHELQHARPPCLSPTLGVYSNSSPLSQ